MERDDLLHEIHRLIDEQMEALGGKLTGFEAAHYAERKKRICELLQKLSEDGFGKRRPASPKLPKWSATAVHFC